MTTKTYITVRDYFYGVRWSKEDEAWLGTCFEFPSMSHLAASPAGALNGIFALIAVTLVDMEVHGETPPAPGELLEDVVSRDRLCELTTKRVLARQQHGATGGEASETPTTSPTGPDCSGPQRSPAAD